MRESKRKRLEAKGWRVGGAQEFLGLTDQELALIDIKLRFADALRKRRISRHLTQAQVARLVRSSQSRVAKMEAADESVSLDLMVRSLLALGLSNQALARAILRAPTKTAA